MNNKPSEKQESRTRQAAATRSKPRALAFMLCVLLLPGFMGCDDPQGQDELPTISIADISAPEGLSGNTAFDFEITLSEPSDNEISFDYASQDGTADGADFGSIWGTATIPAHSTSTFLTVQVVGDASFEPDETFTLILSNAIGASIDRAQAIGTILNDDKLFLSIEDERITETDSGMISASIHMNLSDQSQQAVTVDYTTEDQSATVLDDDYLPSTGTLTFPPGSTRQTLTVNITGDTRHEANEVFAIRLTGSNIATINDDRCEITIVNDDAPPLLSINDPLRSEADCQSATLDFEITISEASGLATSVDYQTFDGTATLADADYLFATGTATIPPGQTSTFVSVSILCDNDHEPDESLTLELSNPVNGTLDKASGLGMITNDDELPVMAISDATITEGNSGTVSMLFSVTLTQPLDVDASFSYACMDGTATVSDGDYQALSGTLAIPAGQTERILEIPILGDPRFEQDETLTVLLSNVSVVSIADAEGLGTIINDDSPPTLALNNPVHDELDDASSSMVFTFSLSAASGLDASVTYETFDESARTSDNDYVGTSGVLVISAGSTSATLEVAILGDTRYEGDETFLLSLSNPIHVDLANADGQATITDDDAMPGISVADAQVNEGSSTESTTMGFPVSLSSPAGVDVSIHHATAAGSATPATDYQSLTGTTTIPAGSTSATIDVAISGDDLYEPDEAFDLVLTNPVNAILVDSSATGTITNDDPIESLSIDDLSLTEQNTNLVFTVTLSGPQGVDVNVDYATADDTAQAAEGDYLSASGSLTIPAGSTTGTITVQVQDDAIYELDEAFTVVLSLPGTGGMATIADGTAVATIIDNDPMPTLSVNDAAQAEGNAGTTNLDFPVILSAVAGVDITVDHDSTDGSATVADNDYSAVSGSLTIHQGASGGVIQVPVTGDTKYEDDEQFMITLSNPTHASLLDSSAEGTLSNDDTLPAVSVHDALIAEGAEGEQTDLLLTIDLSNPSSFPLSVDYATSPGSASPADGDYQTTLGTLDFTPGQTSLQLAVTVFGDDHYEADESFNVTLTNPVDATLADAGALAWINNDDPVLFLVDPTGDDSDGMRWSTAFHTVQQAADAALAAGGGEVWVASAVYTNGGGTGSVVTLRPTVALYGGFSGYAGGAGDQEADRTQRDWTANPTTLDGQTSAYHVVVGADDAIIDGFTITQGHALGGSGSQEYGGGMYSGYASPAVANCSFTHNTAFLGAAIYFEASPSASVTGCLFTDNSATSGAAIMNRQASPLIHDCRFISNISPAATQSGTIYNLTNSAPTISDCYFESNTTTAILSIGTESGPQPLITNSVFLNNDAVHVAGAMKNHLSSPVVQDCLFIGNSSESNGGAVQNLDASPTFESCVFSGNRATDNGGAMYSSHGSRTTLVNCTFAGNEAGDLGGAIYNDTSATIAKSALVWANTDSSGVNSIVNVNTFVVSTWFFSDVEGCGGSSAWQNSCGWNVGGTLDVAPLFTDADGADNVFGTIDDDPSLGAGSPCRDAGDGDSAPALDVLGHERHDDPAVPNTGNGTPNYVDMGAYEAL